MMTNENFEYFYNKYYGFSIRIAFRAIKDRGIAEDLSQEVFYSLYKLGDKLDLSDEGKLYSLVRTATLNKVRDYQKKAYVRHEALVDEHEKQAIFRRESVDVETRMLHMEKNNYRGLVLQRLRDINEMNYDILIKIKYLDIPPELVAKEYGITKNNVNNRIRRTKLWIEAEMSRVYEE